ncbi:MAG: DUF4149 domain-containing protein [Candidatus Eremiobacteraeota bacterium]|nr:DUF4149 domain-containing protein [Candidatus Eremiobacteraeota bacterium]MBC5803321.1 DUF4149 domain-containing protein [Candidatus Eremiobacteraeota bacterium]MBC5822843.1 DUF4149 domain-containing protein [Candidatus Eremiobacteraeota bacterium]
MSERFVTALETAVLGLWTGAMAGFAFVFAPIAIRIVPQLNTFAALVAAVIRGLSSLGAVCGGIAIAAALVRALEGEARLVALARIVLVTVALGASAYETRAVIPRMESIASGIPGPIDSVPKDDPRRAAYDAQHAISSRVYGIAFVCVLAALAVAPFGRKRAG